VCLSSTFSASCALSYSPLLVSVCLSSTFSASCAPSYSPLLVLVCLSSTFSASCALSYSPSVKCTLLQMTYADSLTTLRKITVSSEDTFTICVKMFRLTIGFGLILFQYNLISCIYLTVFAYHWLFALVKHFNKGITIIMFLERTSYSHRGCALNLLNITSKSCTTVMFAAADSHTTLMYTFASMFMINLHTKFH
jgi:hypothetical protein